MEECNYDREISAIARKDGKEVKKGGAWTMLEEKDNFGCTAIHYAVLGGRLKSLGWLLNLQCPEAMVQSKSNLNEFPLHYAARSDCSYQHFLYAARSDCSKQKLKKKTFY